MQISTRVWLGHCEYSHWIVPHLAAHKLYSENDITDVLVDATFSMDDESFGEQKTVDLKPNGRNIALTNDNKKEYVE